MYPKAQSSARSDTNI